MVAEIESVGAATIPCAKCGHTNDATARRCEQCSAHLHVVCRECGETSLRIASHCHGCGARLHPSVRSRLKRKLRGLHPLQVTLLTITAAVLVFLLWKGIRIGAGWLLLERGPGATGVTFQ